MNEPVTSSSNFSRMVNHNFLSNVKLHDIEMPWEQGVARFVFGDELLPSESLTAQLMWTASSLVAGARSHEDVATGLDTALKVVGEVHHSSCFFSAVSNLADVKYADKKQLDLESACTIYKWISILKLCHGASSVSEYIFLDDSDESLKANMEVVEAILGVRSAATAISRANVFRKLLSWVIANFPDSTQILDEYKIWKYFNHLRSSGAAPTAASSAMSSLRYAQHIFGFSGLSEVTNSRRLVGSSEIMYSQKEPVRQAVVLKVLEVLMLHSN